MCRRTQYTTGTLPSRVGEASAITILSGQMAQQSAADRSMCAASTQAMSAEDRRLASNLADDIARVSARAADPTARAWFEREHGGIDAYLDVQRRRLAEVLGRTPVLAVVGHSDVGRTACPGRLFPWADLRRRLV